MAKLKNEFTQAVQELRTAEQYYHAIVHKDTFGMDSGQLDEHTHNCQKALAAKRLAAAKVDAAAKAAIPPKADELVETKNVQ